MKDLKKSDYNLYVPYTDDRVILFNTFTGAIFIVDPELKACLERGDLNSIPDEYRRELKEKGVLIPKEMNEKELYSYMHNLQKYRTDNMSYVILLTYACNLKCPYCYEGAGEAYTKTMDEETMNRVIKYIQKSKETYHYSSLDIGLYGGEPLLCKKSCIKVLDALGNWSRDNNIKFTTNFTTNGTLLDEDIMEYMDKYRSTVQITLDGPKDIHDTKRVYKDGRGTYDLIIENLKKLKRCKGIYTSVRIHLAMDNLDRIPELFLELDREGLSNSDNFYRYIAPITATTEFSCSYDRNTIHKKDSVAIHTNLWKELWDKGIDIGVLPKRNFPVYCGLTTNSSWAIDPYGDVYKCLEWCGHKEHKVFSITEEGEQGEVSPKLYEIINRNPLHMEECRDCIYLPMCSGGCASKAYFENGSYNSKYCELTKEITIPSIQYYIMHREGKI